MNGEWAKIGKLTGSPTVVTWGGDRSQSQSSSLTSAGHTFQHTRQQQQNQQQNQQTPEHWQAASLAKYKIGLFHILFFWQRARPNCNQDNAGLPHVI